MTNSRRILKIITIKKKKCKKRLSWCGNDIGNTFCLLIHPSPFYSCITKPLATSDGHTYRISLVVIKGWKWNLAYSTIHVHVLSVNQFIIYFFLLFSYILLKRVVLHPVNWYFINICRRDTLKDVRCWFCSVTYFEFNTYNIFVFQ